MTTATSDPSTPGAARTAVTTATDESAGGPVGSDPTAAGIPLGLPAGVEQSEAELAARLRLSVTRLYRRLRQHTVGGLTASQASALSTINRLGAPTLGELAEWESIQPPSMTRIVANLEQAGYVKRVVDQADRRVARVTLLAPGRKVLQQNRSLKNAFLARQLRQLDGQEREALGELTVLLERLLELEDP
ncbi:MAG TPA: MarR family transcriptional regulator [Acidimicrobiales bacterium]